MLHDNFCSCSAHKIFLNPLAAYWGTGQIPLAIVHPLFRFCFYKKPCWAFSSISFLP